MVHFVGAGPGAPDLITLRGASLLKAADVIIYAGSLVNPALLDLAGEDCDIHNSAHMTLEQVIEVMKSAHARGKEVVRLHTGDPSIYGAIREQMDQLDRLQIPYDDTPGVSSFCAAAASTRAEYTLPGVSQSLIITRIAGRTAVPERERLSLLAAHGTSMAIFLSASYLEEIQTELLAGAYSEQTPAAIVYKATWPDEKVLHCTVGTLAECGREHQITKTALVLVGDFLDSVYERSRLYDPSFTTMFRRAETGDRIDENSFSQRSLMKETVNPPATRNCAFLTFTEKGEELALSISEYLGGTVSRCGLSLRLEDWTREHFSACDALIFIGAAGIAVRAIAPFVQSKTTDPAVVAVDEKGRYAIPVLSGHLGGANDLAREIAALLGGEAVITTATDVRGVFAVDDWARRQGCAIIRPERIKDISGQLLDGKTIRLWSQWKIRGEVPGGVVLCDTPEACDAALTLKKDCCTGKALLIVPRILALGIGCRKGITAENLERFFAKFMEENGYPEEGIFCVASLDRKAEEPGLKEFCQNHGWPFYTYSQEELAAIGGSFTSSAYVQQITGLDNVCERSALKGAGQIGGGSNGSSGELVCRKKAGDGITMALAQAPFDPCIG